MKIIAITSGSFPYGGAVENRHISYLSGLVQLNCSVKVFLIKRAKNQSELSNKQNGNFKGIKYHYCNWEKKKDNILSSVYQLLNCYKQVKKELNHINSNCNLLILTKDPLSLFLFNRLAKQKNIKIFHERTEFPFINNTGLINKLSLNLYYKQLQHLDGLFVITKNLKNYFSKYLYENKIKHIPMTVEPERFDFPKSKSEYGCYIGYCGSMYTDKDGLPILIKAFDKFASEIPDINLVLIGDISDKSRLNHVNQVIDNSTNNRRIFFTGFKNRDEIPQLLVNAEALVLARPDNIQAKGGFPTKLGEYLATGNPVVVTSVGEIPNYLEHLKNSFIAKPDDINDFYEKLKMVFLDKERAQRIGAEGKKLVDTVFNNQVQAMNLYNFITGN